MANFILGMLSIWFLLNIIALGGIMFFSRKEVKSWRIPKMLILLFFGVVLMFIAAFEDAF